MTPLILSQILSYGVQIMLAYPSLLQAGRDTSTLFAATGERLKRMITEQRAPTAEEWAEMNTLIAVMREELHRPE